LTKVSVQVGDATAVPPPVNNAAPMNPNTPNRAAPSPRRMGALPTRPVTTSASDDTRLVLLIGTMARPCL
jgi:hypothetical protein